MYDLWKNRQRSLSETAAVRPVLHRALLLKRLPKDGLAFPPKEMYEKEGDVPNVVFPCGNVVIGDKVLIYYGGGDKVVNVASLKIDELLKVFE